MGTRLYLGYGTEQTAKRSGRILMCSQKPGASPPNSKAHRNSIFYLQSFCAESRLVDSVSELLSLRGSSRLATLCGDKLEHQLSFFARMAGERMRLAQGSANPFCGYGHVTALQEEVA